MEESDYKYMCRPVAETRCGLQSVLSVVYEWNCISKSCARLCAMCIYEQFRILDLVEKRNCMRGLFCQRTFCFAGECLSVNVIYMG